MIFSASTFVERRVNKVVVVCWHIFQGDFETESDMEDAAEELAAKAKSHDESAAGKVRKRKHKKRDASKKQRKYYSRTTVYMYDCHRAWSPVRACAHVYTQGIISLFICIRTVTRVK